MMKRDFVLVVSILMVSAIYAIAATKIQVRRGLDANLPATLSNGEPAFTTDTHRAFYGYSTGKEELATMTRHGLYSSAQQVKFNNKAETVHTQGISTVNGLQAVLNNNSTSTQAKLNNKAETVHTQAMTTVTGLPEKFTNVSTALDGKKMKHGWNISPPVKTELSFSNSGNHPLTVTVGGGFNYYFNSAKATCSSPQSVDLGAAPATGLWFVYFDDTSCTLKASQTPWNFYTTASVATVFWNGTTGSVQDERHFSRADIAWRQWAHKTIGTRWVSGLQMTAPSVASPSTVNFSGGTIYDEDIEHSISTTTAARVWYQTGASTWSFQDPATTPYITSASYVNNSYVLTDVTSADYINMWFYATGDIDKPIYAVVEKVAASYNTVALARAVTPPDLSTFAGNAELKILYRAIYKGDNTVAEVTDYRSSSPLPGGGAAATTAAAVTYTPTTPFTNVTVQGAIDQTLTLFPQMLLTPYDNGTCTTTTSIDPANGEEQTLALGGNCTATIALSASGKARKLFLRITQGVSAYTLAIKYTGDVAVKWPGGVAPTFTTTNGAVDDVACRVYSTYAHCVASQDMK